MIISLWVYYACKTLTGVDVFFGCAHQGIGYILDSKVQKSSPRGSTTITSKGRPKQRGMAEASEGTDERSANTARSGAQSLPELASPGSRSPAMKRMKGQQIVSKARPGDAKKRERQRAAMKKLDTSSSLPRLSITQRWDTFDLSTTKEMAMAENRLHRHLDIRSAQRRKGLKEKPKPLDPTLTLHKLLPDSLIREIAACDVSDELPSKEERARRARRRRGQRGQNRDSSPLHQTAHERQMASIEQMQS